MRKIRKTLNESSLTPSFSLIKPSVERWIMDRIDDNHPETLEDVKDYINMQDNGFNLCTKTGDYLAKELMNSFIKFKISWLSDSDDIFDLVVSQKGKLGILYKNNSDINVIIHYVKYDFSKTFTGNLGILSKETEKFISSEFETKESFLTKVNEAITEAQKLKKKTVYLALFIDNPDNKPIFETKYLLKYAVLNESEEKTDESELPDIDTREGEVIVGTWEGDIFTQDYTKKQFHTNTHLKGKIHGAFKINYGHIIQL